MTACMFHECKTESAEDHRVADLGFRFCQWHRDKLARILALMPIVVRGMRLMDFWREARPDYEIKFVDGKSPFPPERRIVKRALPSYQVKQHAALPEPIVPTTKPKKVISENAFSLAGLISEEASKHATPE